MPRLAPEQILWAADYVGLVWQEQVREEDKAALTESCADGLELAWLLLGVFGALRVADCLTAVPGEHGYCESAYALGLSVLARAEEGVEPGGEARCRCDEVSRARVYGALAVERDGEGVADPLVCGRVVSRCDEHRDASLTDEVEPWTHLAGQPGPVRPTDTDGHTIRERAVVDDGAREAQELPQLGGVRVHSVSEDRIAEALEPRHIGIVRDEEGQGRLDQGERAHAARRGRSRDQRPQSAIGVGDDVRAADQQRRQVQGVHLVVLTVPRHRARRIAASVHARQPPAVAQYGQGTPRCPRAGAPMHEQDLRPRTRAHHHDFIHGAAA